MRSSLSKSKIIAIIGFLASVIGIFVFLTGKNIPDFFKKTQSNPTENTKATYTEEQLEALGKAMVCGDLVCFTQDNDEYRNINGTISFVDKNLHFTAFGQMMLNFPHVQIRINLIYFTFNILSNHTMVFKL